MISRSPKLRMIYDDQAKAELDRLSLIKETREEGRAEGEAMGRAAGEAIGRAEGEAKGQVRGNLIGRVRLWQQLLGQRISTDTQFESCSLEDLIKMAERLERQWNKRR